MSNTSIDIKGLDIVTKKLTRLLKSVDDTSKLMGEIGEFLNFSILARTSPKAVGGSGKGSDISGVPFESYSTSYQKLREAKDLPTDVDLFFTGQMTSALIYEKTKEQVKLFFMDTPRKASDGSTKTTKVFGSGGSKASNAEVAYYVNEIREFFGISAEERIAITKMVEDYIDKVLRKK